ncbi:MAG: hypothetical protein JXO51_06485 [Candidatus Aminicenantes bacterium]|nr:hypothetical protein [Candidatus Aminicenantes bacterium]
MATRLVFATLLCLAALPLRAELLKWHLLQKPAPTFRVRQDIFHGSGERPASPPGTALPAQAENLQQSIAAEIAQSVTYEGFIVKNGKRSAMLNVSGEFFLVSEREEILGKIRILAIGKDTVTIEYDGQPYDIRLKGEDNG